MFGYLKLTEEIKDLKKIIINNCKHDFVYEKKEKKIYEGLWELKEIKYNFCKKCKKCKYKEIITYEEFIEKGECIKLKRPKKTKGK